MTDSDRPFTLLLYIEIKYKIKLNIKLIIKGKVVNYQYFFNYLHDKGYRGEGT